MRATVYGEAGGKRCMGAPILSKFYAMRYSARMLRFTEVCVYSV